MSRNATLEVIVAIEIALDNECKDMQMNEPKDRARLAWWIHENFIDGDFQGRAVRREVPKQLPKTS